LEESVNINLQKANFSAVSPMRGVNTVKDAQISYCKKDIMSVCMAETGKRQRECRYYEKSCRSDKCMYFVFEEYCDCLRAQLAASWCSGSA
jgi:hypothetical protein